MRINSNDRVVEGHFQLTHMATMRGLFTFVHMLEGTRTYIKWINEQVRVR